MLWHKHTKAPWTPSAVCKYFPNLLLPLCASQSSSIKLIQSTKPFLKDGEKQFQDSTEGGNERGFILFILQCLVRVSEPVLLKPEGDKHWGESIAEPGSLMRALIREETQESTVQRHLNEYKFSPDWNSSTVGVFPADSVREKREKQLRSSVLILLTLLAVFKQSKLWLFYLKRQWELVKESLPGSDNGNVCLVLILNPKPIAWRRKCFQTTEFSGNRTGCLSREWVPRHQKNAKKTGLTRWQCYSVQTPTAHQMTGQ